MSSPYPVIGVIGATVWGNRGAEAMLATTVGQVRRRWPEARFRVFSYYPVQDSYLIKDERLEILDARPITLVFSHLPFALLCWCFKLVRLRAPDLIVSREIRALRSCDVLLDIPGIAFADGREKFLPFNILTLWPALLLGVPVVKLAQALGPFRNPLNRCLAKIFLRRCHRVFARGPVTGDHLGSLRDPRISWAISADTAFLFEEKFSLSTENEQKMEEAEEHLASLRKSSDLLVGICPSSLLWSNSRKRGRDYTGLLARLVLNVSRTNGRIRFLVFPNATREGSHGARNNDLRAVSALRNELRTLAPSIEAEGIVWVDFDVNTASIRKLLSRADVLITSRFHAMIAALCLSVPSVVIGWSHKYREVLQQFGLGDYSFAFDESPEDLVENFLVLLDDLATIRSRIQETHDAVRLLAEEQFRELEGLLGSGE